MPRKNECSIFFPYISTGYLYANNNLCRNIKISVTRERCRYLYIFINTKVGLTNRLMALLLYILILAVPVPRYVKCNIIIGINISYNVTYAT